MAAPDAGPVVAVADFHIFGRPEEKPEKAHDQPEDDLFGDLFGDEENQDQEATGSGATALNATDANNETTTMNAGVLVAPPASMPLPPTVNATHSFNDLSNAAPANDEGSHALVSATNNLNPVPQSAIPASGLQQTTGQPLLLTFSATPGGAKPPRRRQGKNQTQQVVQPKPNGRKRKQPETEAAPVVAQVEPFVVQQHQHVFPVVPQAPFMAQERPILPLPARAIPPPAAPIPSLGEQWYHNQLVAFRLNPMTKSMAIEAELNRKMYALFHEQQERYQTRQPLLNLGAVMKPPQVFPDTPEYKVTHSDLRGDECLIFLNAYACETIPTTVADLQARWSAVDTTKPGWHLANAGSLRVGVHNATLESLLYEGFTQFGVQVLRGAECDKVCALEKWFSVVAGNWAFDANAPLPGGRLRALPDSHWADFDLDARGRAPYRQGRVADSAQACVRPRGTDVVRGLSAGGARHSFSFWKRTGHCCIRKLALITAL
ncbi:hypothetical protein HMN09_00019800 [Mycena chlorophos]|uniref:Uncharacterized protein n=1 Tax=Mycena chlorophos TaxID=658473 RepID=A0A8H6TR13_MYCCL|nr:hypothetical protein HMN09_00019800 [Mycena chlorophos]